MSKFIQFDRRLDQKIKDKFAPIRVANNDFIRGVHRGWNRVGQMIVANIVKNQLSGRNPDNTGLNRISGNASRSPNVRTVQFTNDVGQFFLLTGPAKRYIRFHDVDNDTGQKTRRIAMRRAFLGGKAEKERNKVVLEQIDKFVTKAGGKK